MSRWVWLAGELKTGRILTEIPLVEDSASVVLDDAGQMRGTLVLSDPDVRALQPRNLLEPGRTFVAWAWVDDDGVETIVDAGPVWTHTYSWETRRLQIGAAGLWSYYDHRKVLRVLVGDEAPAATAVTYSGVSLGTMAKRLVQLAHSHTNGAVPVVLPADETGTEKTTYYGYELGVVGAKLRDITAAENGPEIAFVPRRTGASREYLEWVMRAGTVAAPLLVQPGSDWVWDASVPGSDVAGINVSVDGGRSGSRVWLTGSGSGESRLMKVANDSTLTNGGWPLLEVEARSRPDVESGTQLAALTRSAAIAARTPREQWTVRVKPRSVPAPGQVQPGHWGRVITAEHDLLPDGDWRGRVTSLAKEQSDQVTLTFQPDGGVEE